LKIRRYQNKVKLIVKSSILAFEVFLKAHAITFIKSIGLANLDQARFESFVFICSLRRAGQSHTVALVCILDRFALPEGSLTAFIDLHPAFLVLCISLCLCDLGNRATFEKFVEFVELNRCSDTHSARLLVLHALLSEQARMLLLLALLLSNVSLLHLRQA